jgi:cytochrome c oxidase subunit 1
MGFLSSLIMISSLFAGWEFRRLHPPLSALQAIGGSGLGMTLWLVSMAIFIASSLMGSIYSYGNQFEDRGMSMLRRYLSGAFFVTLSLVWFLFLYYLQRC